MSTPKPGTEIMTRILLIAVILFNALAPTTTDVQAAPESASTANSNPAEAERETKTGIVPVFERPQARIGEDRQGQHRVDKNPINSQNETTTDHQTSTVFIENVGQFDQHARFQTQIDDTSIYFSEDAIWFTILEPVAKDHADRHKITINGLVEDNQKPRKAVNVKINLVDSNSHPVIKAFNKLTTRFSYFAGSDQTNWHSDVPAWSGIRYVDIYPGMDLEINSDQGHLVWQFHITDPVRFYDKNNQAAKEGIRLKVAGHQKLQVQNKNLDIVTEVGELFVPVISMNGEEVFPQTTKNDELIIPVPAQTSISPDRFRAVSYKISMGAKQSTFTHQSNLATQTLKSQNTSSLDAGNLLVYSAYLGNNGAGGEAIAVDQDNAVYVTGEISTAGFPTGTGVFYLSQGPYDTYIAKIDLATSELVYTAFLKKFGSCGVNWLNGSIKVDSNKNVYVTGITGSTTFPTTTGVIDRQLTDICPTGPHPATDFPADGFVLKLNAGGNELLYSTYLGGVNLMA